MSGPGLFSAQLSSQADSPCPIRSGLQALAGLSAQGSEYEDHPTSGTGSTEGKRVRLLLGL